METLNKGPDSYLGHNGTFHALLTFLKRHNSIFQSELPSLFLN
jgi:hypothetical protein